MEQRKKQMCIRDSTGGGELVDELESRGYEFLKEAEGAEKA